MRRSLRTMRSQLSASEISNAQHAICEQILMLSAYNNAQNIALYLAYDNEISLQSIWTTATLQNKQCYFPALNPDKTLRFLPATIKTPMTQNRYAILEPDVGAEKAIALEKLELMLIPLLGFDTKCQRLGMGQGFYDRTLANIHGPLLLGIAYDFQCLSSIETEAWDIPLDAVITEKKIYWRQK